MSVRRVAKAWRVPAWLVDALLGGAVAIVVAIVISADQGGRQDPDIIAYLWAVGLGALMLARRHYPVVVLMVTALGLFAYYAAGYPAVGVAVPVAAALFSAAELGRLLWAAATAAVVAAVSVFFRLMEGQDVTVVVGYELAGHVILMAAAIALGDSVRSRRAVQANARRIGELTAKQIQQDADARVHAERLAIARDLHDSIGHTTSVISLHADVAREAINRDDDIAREALALIKRTAGRTMTELRATVELLRSPREERRPVMTIADLESLIQPAVEAGIEVEVDNALPSGLPATTETAAYRIIQESITNIAKHSTASQATVTMARIDDMVNLTVIDNGAPPSEPAGDEPQHGYGIVGMRERAEALGGRLSAGYEATGFAVRVMLPVPEETP